MNELLPELLEAALEQGVEVSFPVNGHSMAPLIRPGDTVRVRPRAARVRLGDVVAVRRIPGGSLLVHRVVGLGGGDVRLQGDNTGRSDGVYLQVEIVGVVGTVERRGRSVWFGAGWAGPLVALIIRAGLVRRLNQAAFPVYRRLTRRPRGRRSGVER